MEGDSKEYSWRWVTKDEVLSRGPCELTFAFLTSAGSAASATIYEGENTSGSIVVVMEAASNISQQIHLAKGIYCRRGLYVDLDTNATGMLVQWRELGPKKGG